MCKRGLKTVYGLVLVVLVLFSAVPAQAWVTPKIGGAQRTHTEAPMIMPMVTIDKYNDVNVLKEDGSGRWETLEGADMPVMWPLQADAFEPGKPWTVPLSGKAYNFQYGWNASSTQSAIPADCNVWVEVDLSLSDNLNTYDRTANSYNPIFGTDGSLARWILNDNVSMAHNAYAVTPAYANWEATYKIYIGYSATGAENTAFGSDIVTFTWTSVPEPATMALLAIGSVCLFRQKRK